jgi:hypothetical protein
MEVIRPAVVRFMKLRKWVDQQSLENVIMTKLSPQFRIEIPAIRELYPILIDSGYIGTEEIDGKVIFFYIP